jgi:ubiquinone/menaquinone biosynthesis C-methylase UbiE
MQAKELNPFAYMHYIGTQQEQAGEGAEKYRGQVAQGYDAKREDSPKHQAEQRIICSMLDDMPFGNWVLDVPCGTGRFFQFYHDKGFLFRGLDASADMLQIAANKVVDPMKARLGQADVRSLPLGDQSVDAAVMVRLTRWLSPEDCQVALKELQRVTRDRIILTARVANHPHSRPVELFTEALDNDWKLAKNEEGYMPDYRILMFKRTPNVNPAHQ